MLDKINSIIIGALSGLPNLNCMLCKQHSKTSICRYCEDDIDVFGDSQRAHNLLTHPKIRKQLRHANIDSINALGWYAWPFTTLIPALKNRRKPALSEVLANWFARHALHGKTTRLPDYLFPVPTHFFRYLQRGYNPSTELACAIAKHCDVTVIPGWARRVKHRAQRGLNRHQRLKNTRGMYVLNTDLLTPLFASSKRCRIAIVDDVITTGMTVDTLAGLLKSHYPNLTIEVWAIAITPKV